MSIDVIVFLSSYLNIILDHHHYSHSFFSGLLVFSWLFICFLIHLFRQSRVDKFICLFFDTIIDICIWSFIVDVFFVHLTSR
jgi:hypothetical protein